MKPWILGLFLFAASLPAWSEEAKDPAAMPPLNPPAPAPAPAPAPVAAPSSYVEEFLDYRFDIQRKIEAAWEGYLKTYRGSLPRGRAVFTYHVNPEGKITLVEPKTGGHPTLTALAHRTIIEANAKLVAFPEAVKSKHPSGYFNQVAFALK